jgi:hypothetical protein
MTSNREDDGADGDNAEYGDGEGDNTATVEPRIASAIITTMQRKAP